MLNVIETTQKVKEESHLEKELQLCLGVPCLNSWKLYSMHVGQFTVPERDHQVFVSMKLSLYFFDEAGTETQQAFEMLYFPLLVYCGDCYEVP